MCGYNRQAKISNNECVGEPDAINDNNDTNNGAGAGQLAERPTEKPGAQLTADAGSSPRCGKGFFSQNSLLLFFSFLFYTCKTPKYRGLSLSLSLSLCM